MQHASLVAAHLACSHACSALACTLHIGGLVVWRCLATDTLLFTTPWHGISLVSMVCNHACTVQAPSWSSRLPRSSRLPLLAATSACLMLGSCINRYLTLVRLQLRSRHHTPLVIQRLVSQGRSQVFRSPHQLVPPQQPTHISGLLLSNLTRRCVLMLVCHLCRLSVQSSCPRVRLFM